ncbi:efflux transporter outer membrane subunit [Paraburkholderia sp. BR13439]|uniref:efflux transporter outer membrane subunit n=1 Tax=Paraburkholderia sp. BR13439 TaxID=3236996 RepID=UPI0034CD955C
MDARPTHCHFPARLAATAAALSLLLATAGCALIREDTAPAAQIPTEQVRLAQDSQLPQGNWPSTKWWKACNDDQLTALVDRALQDSPTMAVAKARVEASRAQAKLVDASSGLLIGLSASVNRQSVSENGFLGPFAHTDPALGTTGPWYTEGTIGLYANYSVDLWGKDRARVNAAMGVTRAREAEAAQAALLLSSQVVHVYYEIQTTYALRDLLVKAREIRQEQRDATQARIARGLVSRTQMEGAEAQCMQLDQQIDSAQSRIRTLHEMLRQLTGAGPDALPAIAQRPLPDSAAGVPASLGYELLARRPDLQAMRWYVQSSMDQIDAAKAAFYPSFDIRAFIGLDSLHMVDLLRKSSRQIDLIPGLSLPIFDSGRLNANLAATRAESNLLIAQYNESVLNAVREVAQAGIELDSLGHQQVLQEGKLKAAAFAYDSATAQYRQGLLDKSTAQEAMLSVLMEQSQAVEIRSQQLQAAVTLSTVLGGGYVAEGEGKDHVVKPE